ncbi:DUF2520 domain-containing protein [Prolixibacteraceae bacterium JC049]|nr:DUF2520 domain-containing protein [Prolixibacteraceae bacterium JC049]
MKSVVLIGAGNLATQLGLRFKEVGVAIEQVYSRSVDSAKKLADLLSAEFTTETRNIFSADIYIIALADKAFHSVLENIDFKNALILHTAGSISLTELKSYSSNYGVFYPLQTFSKERKVEFETIPICVEANSEENLNEIKKLAQLCSKDVREINSEQRKSLHLAAIFCCNFVNHMYHLSAEVTETHAVDFNILRPLIKETVAKIDLMHPKDAQTGPAVRYDENIMDKHLAQLEDEKLMKELYAKLSKSINYYQNK